MTACDAIILGAGQAGPPLAGRLTDARLKFGEPLTGLPPSPWPRRDVVACVLLVL